MVITRINRYLDGGSIQFEYDNGSSLWIDNRLDSKTRYQFYDKDPDDEDAKIVTLSKRSIYSLIQKILNHHHNELMFTSAYSAFMVE